MSLLNYLKKSIPLLIWSGLATLFFLLPTLLERHPNWVEYYSSKVFPHLSYPLISFSSWIPFSWTEATLVSIFILLPVGVISYFIGLARSSKRKRYLYRTCLTLAISACLLSAVFFLFLGLNYMRKPLSESLSLPQNDSFSLADEKLMAEKISTLKATCLWLAEEMVDTRKQLPEDSRGVMGLSTDLWQTLAAGNEAMDVAAEKFPVLAGNGARPKAVALSALWSYTGITGMFFPFWGEANLNVDQPALLFPATVCHEVAHVRGIAREQDANMAALLACISSSRPDFRYSGYSMAFAYCAKDLLDLDKEAYAEVTGLLDQAVWRDWEDYNAYWLKFKGPVREVSNQVNDAYLKSNRQSEGLKSYNQITSLLVSYYDYYIVNTEEKS